MHDKQKVNAIQIIVIRAEITAPNLNPNKPEKIVPIKGKYIIKKYMRFKKFFLFYIF